MKRITLIALGLAVAGAAVTASAQDAKPAATKKPAATQSRKELRNEAKGLALATDVTETISDNQLQISHRVLTGAASCEFNQTVRVEPIEAKPGHFQVAFNNVSYVMTPQETTTGAVRLEDKRNGIVWLQIPSKSMMMNQKAGQRMVDGCQHAEQRAATQAVSAAAK